MNDISKEILSDYQTRKTKAQKSAFIEFMKGKYPEITVEEGGFLHNRNLVLGDIENAGTVLTAHYDTCSLLPVPNLVMPKSPLLSFGYAFLLALPFVLVAFAAEILVISLTDNGFLGFIAYFGIILLTLVFLVGGKPSSTTANDNTSGVITLCEIYGRMTDAQKRETVLVFFDNEENGLFGSMFYAKKHKERLKNIPVINFDCVSDGDDLLVIQNKKAGKLYESIAKSIFVSENPEKRFEIVKSQRCFYPSDQANFPVSMAVAAFRRTKLSLLYLDKIHTKKDTAFDEENIELIAKTVLSFINEI